MKDKYLDSYDVESTGYDEINEYNLDINTVYKVGKTIKNKTNKQNNKKSKNRKEE